MYTHYGFDKSCYLLPEDILRIATKGGSELAPKPEDSEALQILLYKMEKEAKS